MMNPPGKAAYLWDYNIDETTFDAILSGAQNVGALDRAWAATRLIEYAPYDVLVAKIGFRALCENWPSWREKVRSQSRRRGLDWLTQYLADRHPELLK